MPCMIITLMSIVYLSFHHLLSPLKVLGNSGDQQDWSQGLWGDFHTKGKMGSYIFKTSDHSFTSFMDHLALLFFSAKKKKIRNIDFWVWNLCFSFGWTTGYADDERNMTCVWGAQRKGEEKLSE